MSFAYPWAFLLAGLLPVVVALYLQRPRRRKVEVSTLLFWQKLLEREPHRKFLGRLRNPLSLLLQLLIFLLLLLALVRPEWGHVSRKRSTVVVLDARARMQAGIFSAARDRVKGIVARAGPDEEIALLGAENAPQIVSPFSSVAKDLRQKLSDLKPSDGGGSMDESLSLAQQLLAGRSGDKRLVVVTDRPLGDRKGIEQVLVGQPRDNLAILAIAQRPLPSSPQSAEIFVKVANFSTTEKKAELELSLDNRILDLKKLILAPGEMKSLSSIIPEEVLQTGQGLLLAKLNAPDALAVDNVARATLPIGKKLRVLQVGADDLFLEQALKADPSLDAAFLKSEEWHASLAAKYDVIIFDNFLPEKMTLGQPGAYLFLGRSPIKAPGQGGAGFSLEKMPEQSSLVWNVDSKGVRLRQASKLQLPQEGWQAETVLEAGGDPAVVALEGPDRHRIVVTSFGVGDSNLPLRAAFPLLISNMVHWLAGNSLAEPAWRAGQTFVPSPGEQVTLLPRDETKEASLPETGNPLKLNKNGFYQVRGEHPRWIAVNTANATESDLRQSSGGGTAFAGVSHGVVLRFWQVLALMALVLLLAEWFFHHRRLTE